MGAPADPNDRPVPLIACNPEGLPLELRKRPQWVAFDYTKPKKAGGKNGKVPIDPHSGRKASTTNFATWGTCAQALACAKQSNLGGIGFVFTDSGYVGIDLDNCRDPVTGAIEPWAQKIIDDCATYTEISPSGKGVHCILRGKLPGTGRKKGDIEIYDTGRYFTMTGVRVEGTPSEIADGQAAIDRLVASFNRSDASLLEPDVAVSRPVTAVPRAVVNVPIIVHKPDLTEAELAEWRCDSEFDALWLGSTAGFGSASEADLRLTSLIGRRVGHNAVRMDRIFRRSGLYREKWDENRGVQTYGQKTIQRVIDDAKRMAAEANGDPTAEPSDDDFRIARALTDSGNAERLVKRYGARIRYCAEWGKWLVYKRGRWIIDVPNEVLQLSKQIARSIYAEAEHARSEELRKQILVWARASEKAERRRAMVALAQAEYGIPIRVSRLDADPNLLNCKNGTLDLTTFELRKHRPEDYLTKMCGTEYVADAQCPTWLAFLERVLPDPEIREFLQRFIGYGLTGDVIEQLMLLLVGEGQNGKSTFATVIQEVLGLAYAIQISAEVLIAKNQRNHPTEIADLFGVRMAFGTETGKNQELDEPLVKQLTGGDPLRARRMREDFWQFMPSHKLILLTNYMPVIKGTDYAIWRRLLRVSFDVRIPKAERDSRLITKLLKEREGILAWAVDGCRKWRTGGLAAPDSVSLAEKPSLLPPKPADLFIAQFVSRAPGERTPARALYEAHCTWVRSHGWTPISQTEFGRLLGYEGFGRTKSGGVMVYVDTRLGEGWGGKGPPPTLLPSSPPRVEINVEDGPYYPQPSLNALPDVQEADFEEPTEAPELARSPSDEPWEH